MGYELWRSHVGLEQCLHCGGGHLADPGHSGEREGPYCVLPRQGENNLRLRCVTTLINTSRGRVTHWPRPSMRTSPSSRFTKRVVSCRYLVSKCSPDCILHTQAGSHLQRRKAEAIIIKSSARLISPCCSLSLLSTCNFNYHCNSNSES